jgi:hypothetical protein
VAADFPDGLAELRKQKWTDRRFFADESGARPSQRSAERQVRKHSRGSEDGYPEPELGLVITYSYLWSEEAAAGHAEGRKTRPCAIEIPTRVKRHLGLDGERSWVILDELNVFRWPGYDLRPIPDKGGRYDYGLLPPKFFETIVKRFSELRKERELAHTSRDDEK